MSSIPVILHGIYRNRRHYCLIYMLCSCLYDTIFHQLTQLLFCPSSITCVNSMDASYIPIAEARGFTTHWINICMKTSSRASRDARTKETPEPEISYRRFWRFFLLFLFYFFANASICAYPAEKSMGSSRSFFLTTSRPS